MNGTRYSFADIDFAYFTKTVLDRFEQDGLTPVLVGGVAVQAKVLDVISRQSNRPIKDLDELTLSEYVRPQRDLNLAVAIPKEHRDRTSEEDPQVILYLNQVMGAIKGIPIENVVSPDESDIFDVRPERLGLVNPVFSVYSLGRQTPARIPLEVIHSPRQFRSLPSDRYYPMVDTAQEVVLGYSPDFKVKVRTPTNSYLIGSKLNHGKPRDLFDALVLGRVLKLVGINPGKYKEPVIRVMGDIPDARDRFEAFEDSLNRKEVTF